MSNSPAPSSVFDLLTTDGVGEGGEALNKQRQAIFAAQERESAKELTVNVREMSLMLEFYKGRNSDLTTELALSESKYALMVQYVKSLEDKIRFMSVEKSNDLRDIERAASETNEREKLLDDSVNPDLSKAIKENVTH